MHISRLCTRNHHRYDDDDDQNDYLVYVQTLSPIWHINMLLILNLQTTHLAQLIAYMPRIMLLET